VAVDEANERDGLPARPEARRQEHAPAGGTRGRRTAREARCFVTAGRGAEDLLAAELRHLDLTDVRQQPGGASFAFTGLGAAYRACLWSRVGIRVLLPLTTFPAEMRDQVYQGVRRVDWDEHLSPDATLACDVTGTSPAIVDTHFGAQLVKDAVVDQVRERHDRRPSVELHRPNVRLNLHLSRGRGTLSIDLAGESLHRRGYREPGKQVEAPLKETLAAAILLAAGWPRLASEGGSLTDPLCGSGTLLLEGALMAADVAPGLLRDYWGFAGWRGHDAGVWDGLLAEARERRLAGLARLRERQRSGAVLITGADRDARALRLAQAAVERAGLRDVVNVQRADLPASAAPLPTQPRGSRRGATPGLVVANPPYGERLRDPNLAGLYRALAQTLAGGFEGWRAAILVADRGLGDLLPLIQRHDRPLFNGPLPCTLLLGAVSAQAERRAPKLEAAQGDRPASHAPADATEFANRLRRNLRTVGRTMRRAGISCFRLYDADLPDYNLAVDLYDGWAHLQEYAAPAEIDPGKAAARLQAAVIAVTEVLELPAERVVLKVRRRQRGELQYERQAEEGHILVVNEGEAAFQVNLSDYLDTGLFLDQRLVRGLLHDLADGRSFLNLFGYTGTASVAAARGGATGSLTLDLSSTYLDWARRNFRLNGLDPRRHELLRADCLPWLTEQSKTRGARRFGLIYLAPPTFSNSKRMGDATFDAQRDHTDLIRTTAELLEPGGVLVFTTARRNFKLDHETLAGLRLTDLSRATLPPDFVRRAHSHHVWRIERP
jgi:23S rRNA (guanine2445-N2)-methyltransferase / 23S rRNA (guanine2069-N7)-methyltransferase